MSLLCPSPDLTPPTRLPARGAMLRVRPADVVRAKRGLHLLVWQRCQAGEPRTRDAARAMARRRWSARPTIEPSLASRHGGLQTTVINLRLSTALGISGKLAN